MKVLVYTVICSPLDDALGSEAKIRTKADTIQAIKGSLEIQIPDGYRCSIVVATKEKKD